MSSFFAVLLSAGIFFSSLPAVQAQMGHKMKMPEGVIIKTIEADICKVRFRIMDRLSFRRDMDAMDYKSHSMKAGSTHYIMLGIIDLKGNKVT